MLDPMTGKEMDLPTKICHMEGGAEQVNIGQVCEVIRCLADLLVSDDRSVQREWYASWLVPAARRREATGACPECGHERGTPSADPPSAEPSADPDDA